MREERSHCIVGGGKGQIAYIDLAHVISHLSGANRIGQVERTMKHDSAERRLSSRTIRFSWSGRRNALKCAARKR
jgi:hypothetical protein